MSLDLFLHTAFVTELLFLQFSPHCVFCIVSTQRTLNLIHFTAVEIDYLWRRSRKSRLERKSNEEIRERMNAREAAVDRMVWTYSADVECEDEISFHRPKKSCQWKLPG